MKFELDLEEAEAKALVYDLRNDGSDLEKEVADQIDRQVPIPAPTKLGAVVRTDLGIAVLSDRSAGLAGTCWVLNTDDDYLWRTVMGIGRITEVLSEGVDL